MKLNPSIQLILKKRGIFYLFLVIASIIIVLLPDYIIQNNDRYCPHYVLTGCECPLCGMIRATRDICYFNFLAAFHYNMGIYLLMFYLVIDFLSFWIKRPYFILAKKISLAVLLVGFLAIYALRVIQFLM